MQLTAAVTALLLPAAALGAFIKRADTWTITNMKRVCDITDTSCMWSFGINTPSGSTPCSFSVTGSPALPASRTPEGGAKCGAYTVTSGWSGQFGDGKGFTTLSVIDYTTKQIVWPAYTDAQLASGNVVTPDQSYPVSNL